MSETPRTDASEKAAEISLRNAGMLAAGLCRVLDMQDLEFDNARLRKALEDIAACNTHYGKGPHCTCSQNARTIIIKAALRGEE